TEALDAFGEQATEAAGEAKTAASNIEKAFTAPDWKGLGRDIASGIAEGIRAGTPEIEEAAAAAADAALAAGQEASQSHSPSRKAYQLGQWLMEGFAWGIREQREKPVREAAAATRVTLEGARGGSGAGAGGQASNGLLEQILGALRGLAAGSGRGGAPTITINVGGQELRRVAVDGLLAELAA
ncbi:MAG: hypothetical protein JW910_21895, partial [Anaerolineae bacterium]|nr:hypothetical protein [Anaerolineae bacterium]